MPFIHLQGTGTDLPKIQLEQVDAKNFTVLRGFRYQNDRKRIRVRVGADESTDLASVPFFLRWFVGTYGKHTRAAILHDHMWRKPSIGVQRRASDGTWQTDTSPIHKSEANTLFRIAMADVPKSVAVGPVKRWIMWAAVTLDTLRTRLPDGILIYAFLALHLTLDALLVVMAVGSNWFILHDHRLLGQQFPVALLVFPAALALLWPRHPVAGLVASYALVPLVIPIVVTLLTLVVFVLASIPVAIVQRVRSLLGFDVGPIFGLSVDGVKSAVLALPPKI